jgi:hypothetical protein
MARRQPIGGDHVTLYAILEVYGPQDPEYAVHKIEAATPTDALAEYSIREGFADPRQYIGTEEDFFYTRADGTVGMVFTNTELKAVPC